MLDALKDDPSSYVRRSVANHLGDIAKDHPDLAVGTACTWLQGAPAPREALVRHGLRFLIKRSDAGALGQILRELLDQGDAVGAMMRERISPMIEKLHASPKPVVTAVNGAAAGAGVDGHAGLAQRVDPLPDRGPGQPGLARQRVAGHGPGGQPLQQGAVGGGVHGAGGRCMPGLSGIRAGGSAGPGARPGNHSSHGRHGLPQDRCNHPPPAGIRGIVRRCSRSAPAQGLSPWLPVS